MFAGTVAMVLCALHNFIEGTGNFINTSELAASDVVASHVLGTAGHVRSEPDGAGDYLMRENLAAYIRGSRAAHCSCRWLALFLVISTIF